MRSTLLLIALVAVTLSLVSPSSGQRRSPRTAPEYGVNLTFAVYSFDEQKSQTFAELIRLPATFSTPQEEINFIRDRYGAEEMTLRHVRSIGLTGGEFFTDVQRLGPDFMRVTVRAQGVGRSRALVDISAQYGTTPLLEQKGLTMENYETLAMRGKGGMFGLRTFVGPGGVTESEVAHQSLLLTVTAEVVTPDRLRNRPRELTHPTDEHGVPLKWEESDKYVAPYVLTKVEPTLPLRRPLAQTVLLQGIITPDGKVTNVRVLRSIDPDIDKIAIDAFRRYRFQGGQLNGQPVHASWREEIAFRVPGVPTQ